MVNNVIGLNALFGIPDSKFEVVELVISDICGYKKHKFGESSQWKDEQLTESIKQFGVLEPVIVRPEEDTPYDIKGKYELLAGHRRTKISDAVGKKTVPAIIMNGLSEDEVEQIVIETNMQRSFEEMTYSERAAVLAAHYNAQKRANVRKEVLDEINSYLQTYANPVNSMAEEGLSTGWTAGVRDVAKEYDLSKSTIAMYIRVDTLIDGMKLLLDDGHLPFKAAVELSYISAENQELFVSLINSNEYKCKLDQAKAIRELQTKNKLTVATMTDVLSGKLKKKKPGAPKGYKVSGKVIQKYFPEESDEKKIGEIIEEALKKYFEKE